MTDEQQHEKLAATQSNPHKLLKLLSVQELIFSGDAVQMYPLVEASGGQEQYYIRSA